jgi:4,5-DOPA dioxygenase extradiol
MEKMPAVFIGHGSPMNAIEDNAFTRGWKEIAAAMPRPEAILSVSAHWYTPGTRVMNNAWPRMIYDMYGFPKELYEVIYPAPGAPELAKQTHALLDGMASLDDGWGFDHGTWSVLGVMFPMADIPVVQLSVDRNATPKTHYEIGQRIASLREQGILVLGSGNVVHNLSLVDFDREDGFDWAYEFDAYIHAAISGHKHANVIEYRRAGECAKPAFPSPDHYYPLLTVLGATGESDAASVFNEACVMGSLSMTCYLFQ